MPRSREVRERHRALRLCERTGLPETRCASRTVAARAWRAAAKLERVDGGRQSSDPTSRSGAFLFRLRSTGRTSNREPSPVAFEIPPEPPPARFLGHPVFAARSGHGVPPREPRHPTRPILPPPLLPSDREPDVLGLRSCQTPLLDEKRCSRSGTPVRDHASRTRIAPKPLRPLRQWTGPRCVSPSRLCLLPTPNEPPGSRRHRRTTDHRTGRSRLPGGAVGWSLRKA